MLIFEIKYQLFDKELFKESLDMFFRLEREKALVDLYKTLQQEIDQEINIKKVIPSEFLKYEDLFYRQNWQTDIDGYRKDIHSNIDLLQDGINGGERNRTSAKIYAFRFLFCKKSSLLFNDSWFNSRLPGLMFGHKFYERLDSLMPEYSSYRRNDGEQDIDEFFKIKYGYFDYGVVVSAKKSQDILDSLSSKYIDLEDSEMKEFIEIHTRNTKENVFLIRMIWM